MVSAIFDLIGSTGAEPTSETEPAQAKLWPTAAILRAARAVECAPGATVDRQGNLRRTGIDYSGQDLRGADFEGQDLTCDNFAGANLQGANLTYTDLSYTNFEGVDLREADLFFSGVLVTNFTDALWRNTRCADGTIAVEDWAAPSDTIIRCTSLTPAGGDQFYEARAQDCPSGTGEDLGGQNLSGADLAGRDLSCADLSYADLSSANLRGADLSGALLWGTNLRDADLSSATFRHAWLGGAKFQNALLRDANFDDTDLFFTDLTGADITGASIVNTVWGFGTQCGDTGYPWRPGESFERETGLECPGIGPVGSPRNLPDDYPSATMVIGGIYNRSVDIAPLKTGAVWDECGALITAAETTPYHKGCVKLYTDAGIIYISYHPLSGVEYGSSGREGMIAAYPGLFTNAAFVHFDGTIDQSGTYNLFSNSSDIWLDFMIGVIETQVEAGMTGIGFDEGWGTLGPGPVEDFSPAAIEGFRQYLEGRYGQEELAQKGITDISTFNYREEFDDVPLLEKDYQYYARMRLREIYTRLSDEIKPYAAAKGQPWYLSGNIYNGLGWDNAAVGAVVMDLPMGELSTRDSMWPDRNFTSFFKNMAALGKRFNSMFWPGQVLYPSNDPDTEALLMFLADVYASGGVSQHPGAQYNDLVNSFYQLIQAHENFFAETDNRVALYYSLSIHMGDVDREGVKVNTYYGAARLLEDSHYSYDVLYQGDPDMGPGTVRWVDQQVSLADMQEYQLIVLPHTRHMSDEEVRSFLDYVQSGGVLVVFGEAGTYDFSYPTPNQRSNSTWENLVSAAGTHSFGSGSVRVVSDGNIASDYDVSLAPADLAAFNAAMEPVYPLDVSTTLSKDVHIYKFRDPAAGLEVFHLVNFGYDEATDLVAPTKDNTFAFDPSGNYIDPRVVYYTPESPEGETLSVIQLPSGFLEVMIPTLHVYGIVVVQEAE